MLVYSVHTSVAVNMFLLSVHVTVEVLMIAEVGHPQRRPNIVAVEYSSWPISALLKGGHFQITSPVHSSKPLFMVLFP